MLATLLVTALIASPLFRLHAFRMDHTDPHPHSSRRHRPGQPARSRPLHAADQPPHLALASASPPCPSGFVAAATIAGGTAFLDRALATALAGAVLSAIASTGARNPLNATLRRGPLAFYGRISYGLYMTHIMVFIYFGWFDARMDHYGIAGNLAVVAFRLAASTLAATMLWYGFESRILSLKRYFENSAKKQPSDQSFSL